MSVANGWAKGGGTGPLEFLRQGLVGWGGHRGNREIAMSPGRRMDAGTAGEKANQSCENLDGWPLP